MFDHHRHRIARRGIGREGHEQRMVAAVPWQVFVAGHAAGAFLDGDVAHLAGPGLARHPQRIGADPGAPGGAAPVVRHREHAAPDLAQRVFGDVHRRRRHGRAHATDSVDKARRDRPARGDPRRHHRQLQGRGQHVALADPGIERVADPPGGVAHAPLPRPIGDQPAGDRHRQIIALAQPQLARHRRDRVDPDPLGDVVVIDVAGLLEAVVQVHLAMPAAPPAMKAAVAKLVVAGTEHRLVRADRAGLQRGQRHHHLEGRAGRIGAMRRLADQRSAFVVQQRVVVGHRDAADKGVRVKARRRAERPDIAGRDLHHHGSGTFPSEPGLDEVLQLVVDRQLDVGAGLALLPVEFADHPPGRVDLDPAGAGTAAKRRFHLGLCGVFADLEIGNLQQRVGIVEPLQIVVADRPDIAHHMGEIGLQRIGPGQPDLGRDTGQGGGVDSYCRHLFPAQPFGDGDRNEGAAAIHLAQQTRLILGRDRDDPGQPVEHRLGVAGILAHHHDPVVAPVVGQHHAGAVEDQAAGRRDQADVDPVLFGQQQIAFGLAHLQPVHAQGQDAGDRRHGTAHDQRPAGDPPPAFAIFRLGPSHRRWRPDSVSPGSGFLTRQGHQANRATAG
jgi:hypothetical protein